MPKGKAFDCVEMKNSIQARLLEAYDGLTDEEVRQRIHDQLTTSDDIVARKWRRLAQVKTSTENR